MVTIEISPETLERLQAHATPLVDTYDSVIHRLLDHMEQPRKQTKPRRRAVPPFPRRAPKGRKTPNEAFYGPLVKVLRDAGGPLPTSEAVDRVGLLMEDRLVDIDFSPLKSGEPRWRNTVRWARNDLIERGVLDRDAPHGYWRLRDTDAS